jgi:hypothetical protein
MMSSMTCYFVKCSQCSCAFIKNIFNISRGFKIKCLKVLNFPLYDRLNCIFYVYLLLECFVVGLSNFWCTESSPTERCWIFVVLICCGDLCYLSMRFFFKPGVYFIPHKVYRRWTIRVVLFLEQGRFFCVNFRELCLFVMFYGESDCSRMHERLNIHYVILPPGVQEQLNIITSY